MPEITTEIPSSIEQLDLKTRNRLQIELIKRSKMPPDSWIDENSKIFSEIIKNPEIVELIKSNECEALDEIERLIEERKKKI